MCFRALTLRIRFVSRIAWGIKAEHRRGTSHLRRPTVHTPSCIVYRHDPEVSDLLLASKPRGHRQPTRPPESLRCVRLFPGLPRSLSNALLCRPRPLLSLLSQHHQNSPVLVPLPLRGNARPPGCSAPAERQGREVRAHILEEGRASAGYERCDREVSSSPSVFSHR